MSTALPTPSGLGRRTTAPRAQLQPPATRVRALPRSLLVELALVLAGITAYFTARGLTEADPSVAVRHAHDVLAVERVLGLDLEASLQRYVLDSERLIDLVNWVYIWGHWPVITVVLLWTWRRHPPAYVVLRNALLVSGLIGVVVFLSYPVAPPRLADLGLLDTVSERSQSYRVLQPPGFVNKYAAVPSLHVGWNLLVGITVVRCSRHVVVRVLGVLSPLAMSVAVVLSANHYVVDGLLGALVALTGLLVAERLQHRAVHGGDGRAGTRTAGAAGHLGGTGHRTRRRQLSTGRAP